MTTAVAPPRTRTTTIERALAPFAWFVLGFMVLVVLEGAYVRISGSGAGCGNHWPLCNGEIFPHHPKLTTIIEFVHRSLTGALTTLIATLITGVCLTRSKANPARPAA